MSSGTNGWDMYRRRDFTKQQTMFKACRRFPRPISPSFVRCRECDVAKLKKAPRGHPLLDAPTLQPGQCFHMDIGLLRGPSNLAAVLDRKEEAQTKVIHSRHNFVCYLLVVDRKFRYTWAFPLRSRSVPTDLMRTFLAVHGHDTASPNLFISVKCWARSVISWKKRPRPHRCKMVSWNGHIKRWGIWFGACCMRRLCQWSFGLTHWDTRSNRRLHHSGIDQVPYNVWTGRTASVAHLRAFGAHVTVRRSGVRRT
jgi:hypothetical protein